VRSAPHGLVVKKGVLVHSFNMSFD